MESVLIFLVVSSDILLCVDASSKLDCNLIENAEVQLPTTGYQWAYPLPTNVCMSAYQTNGEHSPFYSSEIFKCSPNGDSYNISYSYYNGSIDCEESTLLYTVPANSTSFQCGHPAPCPYSSIKTYFQDATNSTNCAHLPQYNEVSYALNVCVKAATSQQSALVQCGGSMDTIVQMAYYYDSIDCDSFIKATTTLATGCNEKYNTFAEIQCP